MKNSLLTSVGLMTPFLHNASLMADLAIDPKDVVTPDPTTSSQTQPEPRNPTTESMTMIAGGLLVCAVIALAIVRLRNSRQKALVAGTPANQG